MNSKYSDFQKGNRTFKINYTKRLKDIRSNGKIVDNTAEAIEEIDEREYKEKIWLYLVFRK